MIRCLIRHLPHRLPSLQIRQRFMQRCAWLVGGAMVVAGCSADIAQQHHAQLDTLNIQFGPIEQTHYAFAGHAKAEFAYQVRGDQVNKTPLDILLLFDRTASMAEVIKNTADAAANITETTQASAPNTRFAVASVADYAGIYTPDSGQPVWRLDSDFTGSAAQVSSAMRAITLSNGGDTPEAYVRALFETGKLAWRPEAQKIVLFFGDATPHDVDPGRDGQPNTSDDLRTDEVIAQLAEKRIRVIGIHTKDANEVIQFFNKLTSSTQGQAIPLSNAQASAQVIRQVIEGELQKPPALMVGASASNWPSSNIAIGDAAIQFNVPENTPAGIYDFSVQYASSDPELNAVLAAKPMQVRLITGWINYPPLLWLPLLLLLAYLLYSSFCMLAGGYSQRRYVYAPAFWHKWGDRVKYIALDALFYLSIASTALAIYLWHKGLVLSQLLA